MTLHGTVLGKYQILSRLGEGGMGTVYHARDEMLDRDVAIKVLRPDLARQASLVERFRSEAIALARLTHPNIAALYGLERDGGQLLMIMEFVQGETLEARLHRTGGIPWRRAVELCVDVCNALDHAHDQGVVHRDIKPANLMVTPRGNLKVMDFGIARVIGRGRQTQVGRSVGTPMYMAPEQLRGEEVDGRTDIYALGAVLFELITGQLAFDADSDYSLMLKQLNEPPPAPSTRVRGLPRAVDAIVSRAMAKQPDSRFASAAAMRGDLLRVAHDAPVESSPSALTPQTRLAVEAAPIPRTPVPSGGAEQRTRVATPAPTRLAADTAEVRPTRLSEDDARHRAPSRLQDWRVWSIAAALLIVAAGLTRFGRSPSHADGTSRVDSLGTPASASSATPVVGPPTSSPSAAPGATAAPTLQGGASAGPDRSPTVSPPTVRDPRLDGAHPLVPDEAKPPRSRAAAPADSKPRETPPPQPVRPSPTEKREPETQPPAPTPIPESKPSENAEAISAAARATVSNWIAAITEGTALAGTMDAGTKSQAALLDLVRSQRVGLAVQDAPTVDVAGATATAAVSATASYRSPFGASRRTPVQFALDLVREGAVWRVAKARIVGSPRFD